VLYVSSVALKATRKGLRQHSAGKWANINTNNYVQNSKKETF
jgi:hypothetical protein